MFGFKLVTVIALAAAASARMTVRSHESRAVVRPMGKIVFRPQVTAPAEGDVWEVNTVQTITWDTASIPPEGRNQTGLILLGFMEEGSTSENLDTVSPLAAGFPITAGAINVTVPLKAPRDDYIVVLFGDSGNVSPKFSISAPSIDL